MRSTIVPAQITTVEDRITSRLGMSQLLLLTLPIFGGSALFVVLPPFFSYATYKVVLMAGLAFFCGLLAIRIKGRILLSWAIALLKYNLRPRYYIYSKNSAYNREADSQLPAPNPVKQKALEVVDSEPVPQLSTAERVQIEGIMSNPQAKLYFKTNKKGELRGYITEVQ